MAKCAAFALIWGPTFDKNYLYLLDHVKQLGFDGIEMPLIPSILNALPISEMKKKVAETGLACVFCAGLDLNQDIASGDKEKRQRGIEHLKKCVDVVKEFDEVVFSADVNTVQGPVKTQFGYHLLEVTSRTD